MELHGISADRPVLIAGPTASGKSALALRIVEQGGGVIVNADALQVYSGWRILTARPSREEEVQAPHALFGHVGMEQPYSVGHWLREMAPILNGNERPVIVGGTGLYLSALTKGLALVPATPPAIRAEADVMPLDTLLAQLDPQTAAGLDQRNRARVQRAWEVLRSTGRGLAEWQAETPPPLLPLETAHAFVLRPEVPWLNARIEARFDSMLRQGAMEEVSAALPGWKEGSPAYRALGADQLRAHLMGQIGLEEARQQAIIASRSYAKRQRTWFRSRMANWMPVVLP
ncbi:tRNA (adenosine(37)-N6)-dimethylallyltransferase MiaA [Rubellimicrobium rubrum]|uniref:tRNA dimethylallyltransferase n=1 Tax=Rubellimicrobium rubrum TaxID=2585369 RepID=A0A5C4N1F6_9RHOB|nr:tRNA (adenosine(37)-N6)-dimethylallyltransferase MiaA [Rubellimicrobium rubrum]TNC51120.1 tRNA (adenosine(37)-N6)-dimethylallyltransferase MiaA [Rubellimicrobium rubrum]